jgi:hypothetical protein
LLSSLLNEPMPGHGVFWSSTGATPYPIPLRTLLFEYAYRPLDPRYDSPAVDCFATTLRNQLTDALDAAVQAAGGRPVTVAGRQDASETYKLAAVRQLAEDADFQRSVRGSGIPWGAVQKKLAGYLTDFPGDAFRWVFENNLVETALDDILGHRAWRTEGRPIKDGGMRKWIIATGQAREIADSVPEVPEDRLPDEETLDNPLF